MLTELPECDKIGVSSDSRRRPLMFRQESLKQFQPELAIQEEEALPVASDELSTSEEMPAKPRRLFAKIRDHEWVTGLLYGLCDVACWVLLYGIVA